jgi:hypothetical protein
MYTTPPEQGCQIYHGPKKPKRGKNTPNYPKIYQMAIKYFQWPQNRTNGHKIYQDFQ